MNNQICNLTGLEAPPGPGAPAAAWPRPERVKTDKPSTLASEKPMGCKEK